MNFREYFQTSEQVPGLSVFFQEVEARVEVHEDKGSLNFSFPKNYDELWQKALSSRASPQPQQYSLAAWNVINGPVLKEATGSTEGGKGAVALKSIDFKTGWTPQQELQFTKGLEKNIRNVGKEMGLLFELECFFYLNKRKRLRVVEHQGMNTMGDLPSIQQKWQEYKLKIAKKTSASLANLLYTFVSAHGKSMGESMYTRALRFFKPKKVLPDEVEFTGGEEEAIVKGRSDPADIRIWNSQIAKSIGYNIKMTSETKVGVASLGAVTMYKMLGGRDVEIFKQDIKSIGDDTDRVKKYVLAMLKAQGQAYFTDPSVFAYFANWLLSGGAATIPAVRNYIRNRGVADFANALQLDFDIRGNRLYAKEGAELKFNTGTNTYFQVTYKAPGGSTFGTSIWFEPAMVVRYGKASVPRVVVKMNNLASEGEGGGYKR